MPVDDHPVHPLTIQVSGSKYGCHNRPPMSPGYWAPDREHFVDETFQSRLVWIPHTASRECKFDLRETDQRCEGCVHKC